MGAISGAISHERIVDELAYTSTRADLAAIDAEPIEREALVLLAQTARALHDILTASLGTSAVPSAHPRTPYAAWQLEQRVSRMRVWLDDRARNDPSARPSAALCAHVQETLGRLDR